jgi:hypothetical protein
VAIDISDLTLIEDENDPNRPQTQNRISAIDLSDLTPIEEPQDDIYYLDDKDKTVGIPAGLDEQQANEEIQVQEYGNKYGDLLFGAVIEAPLKSAAQLGIMLGKVLPVLAEEDLIVGIGKLEDKQAELADKIIAQENERSRIEKDDPDINNFFEIFTDAVAFRKADLTPRGLGFLDPNKSKLFETSRKLEESRSQLKASLAIQNALTKLAQNHLLQPTADEREIEAGPFSFTIGQANQVAFDVGSAVNSMLVSIGSIYAFKNFTIGAGILSSMQKVAVSEEAREAGLPIDERIRSSNISTAFEFAVEYIGGRIFAQGLRGKKTVMRSALRTAEQVAEEEVQLLGEEAVTNWYGIRDTTREQLVERIVYTGIISTIASGPFSTATTISENRGILGDMRELGMTDKQSEAVIKSIQGDESANEQANEAIVELLMREAEKAGTDLDPKVAQGYAFLLGKSEDIDPTLLPTIPQFQDGFEAAEYGSDADKLQAKAMELEKIIIEKQIQNLKDAGRTAEAEKLENGRLAHLNDALEASGPSSAKSITLGQIQKVTTEEAAEQLGDLITGSEGPVLTGQEGDQKRKRTKSGQIQSVQDAGGKKAALNIIQKFLDGKKLTDKQQVKFDAMIKEFSQLTKQRIDDSQQEAERTVLQNLQDEAIQLEEQIENATSDEQKSVLQKRLDILDKQIEDLEQREQGKQEREEGQEERKTLIQEAEEKVGQLTALQDQALKASKGKKVRKVGNKILTNKEAIKALNLKLTADEKQELFGTENPTDVQVADFINQSIKEGKALQKEAKGVVKDLQKQIAEGLKKDIKGAKDEARLTLQDFLDNEQQRKKDGSPTKGTIKKTKDLFRNFVLSSEELITPISTRLGKINPEFKRRMREFDFRLQTQINKDAEAISDYLKGTQDLDLETKIALDLALKNGEFGVVQAINEAHGLTEAFSKVQKMLDDIYERAENAGLDVRYLENFWPRLVKDPIGMIEHFKGDEALWAQIGFALQGGNVEFEQMSVEEQAYAINSLMRGFKNPKIATGIPGQLKARIIDKIDAKINSFYHDADFAIVTYIQRINEAVETNKFFGKGSKTDKFLNVEDSIGHFIIREVADKNLSPSQAIELEQILRARFNPGELGAFYGAIKDLGYLTVLGNIDNAMTQIGDLYLSIYKAGFFGTVSAVGKSLGTTVSEVLGRDRRFVELTREDLGIKQLVAEFNLDQPRLLQNAVSTLFKLNGLAFIDNLGKEAAINSILTKYRKMAQKKKLDPDFKAMLDNTFGAENTEKVLIDLRNGLMSEDVKFLMFNEIANAQPITLSELPAKYLETGNGKIFYTLKTFGIKFFDLVRNESLDRIVTGIRTNNYPEFFKGTQNLIRLMIAYVLTNATADLVKDVIYGRPIEMKDTFVQNWLEMMFFDRWSRYRAGTQGEGKALAEKILPPTSIVDNVGKDMKLHARFGDSLTFQEELQLSESVRNIPLVGDPYYYWFGKGRIKSIEKEAKLEKRAQKIEFLKTLPREERLEFERLEQEKKDQKSLNRIRKRLNKLLPQGETVDDLYDSLR